MKSKIDYKELTRLIELLEEKNLSHFELEYQGLHISISRGHPQSAVQIAMPAQPLETPLKPEAPAPTSQANPEENDNLHYVTSPMVGTFYRAPDPSAPPFVKIGEPAIKNKTLCIIEAMKLMNEVESDVDGTVEKIFIKNGKPVEYGQKLFAIKPN